ncbi:phage integrase Arm DNA-binding domain-containing protein, partial [Klebsiella grimontii]|uniref:phage integrase Arm DNA-binding domain-containing protein n=1 Tax=Klebsiella grimontii TaxID=2058152 RepID=UPI0015A74EDE
MGRRRNHERRDLPPNLYVRNGGYYSYRDPRDGKEYGLGRNRRLAVSEAIQANIELLGDAGHVPLREGANKRGNSSRLTQSFHFFMFEPIFSPVNALNQP